MGDIGEDILERERERESGLFKRETEHLYPRPPIHGIGRTHWRERERERERFIQEDIFPGYSE